MAAGLEGIGNLPGLGGLGEALDIQWECARGLRWACACPKTFGVFPCLGRAVG